MTQHPLRHLYRYAYEWLYNELAWGYDMVSWLVSLGQWDRWRRQALRFIEGERVLEVGFGTGELLPLLHVKAEKTIGLEASAAMQRITAHKLQRRGARIPRIQGIVQQLPFADGSLDCVVTTFPASFILDPAAHREFARVLRPAGRLVVVDMEVMTTNPLLQMLLRLVFPPLEDAFERFSAATEAAGLVVSIERQPLGLVQVVILIAQKRK